METLTELSRNMCLEIQCSALSHFFRCHTRVLNTIIGRESETVIQLARSHPASSQSWDSVHLRLYEAIPMR